MVRIARWVLPIGLFVISSLVLAGGPDCQKAEGAASASHATKKCAMSAEDCKKGMAEARNRGWLGLWLEQGEEGALTITKVVAQSPAEKAGFRVGDVLVSLNGVALGKENHEQLSVLKKGLKPGDSVTYIVRRGSLEQSIPAVLGTMPEEVYTAMVGEHMKEHAQIAATN